MTKTIVFFHLYNDFSGSPTVLHNVVKQRIIRGENVEIVTSNTPGVLSDLRSMPNVKYHTYPYSFSKNKIFTFARYCFAQLYTFFFAFKYIFKSDVEFYINTILPIAPALAGRLMGKKVIYHYHENAFVKSTFYRFLCYCMQHLATEIICVSHYQASFLKRKNGVRVEYNSLSKEFLSKLNPNPEEAFRRKKVLMISSLKEYKGVVQFIQIATALSEFGFILVINDNSDNIQRFLQKHQLILPSNITVFPRQEDVARFYNTASLVLNLSDKNLFIETFGLTALEAMSAALPVIVPTVGGIAEFVDDGVNGYKIDVQNIDKIVDTIKYLLYDKEKYLLLAENALKISEKINNINQQEF